MSRIGIQPVAVPAGVTVSKADGRKVKVKGPKGELELTLRPEVDVAVDKNELSVSVVDASNARAASAYHGMTRALLANMVAGVVKPFEKRLEIQGVGWNATMQGTKISLNVGYNKPVVLPIPKGLTVVCPDPTNIVITGCDRQVVGELAATIRRQRPPEPYQGKGVRYKGEKVERKQGKSFGS
jgi:large subunit ribosomal protein L6